MIGNNAPDLALTADYTNEIPRLSSLKGQVILLEFFQLNCPGCFLYSLPLASALYQQYHAKGLQVFAISTAFEDFEWNNAEQLKKFLESNQPVGQSYKVLTDRQQLVQGQLKFKIPFPVVMDNVMDCESNTSVILDKLYELYYPESDKKDDDIMQSKLFAKIQSMVYYAESFNRYRLQGTPSHVLIDKHGIIKAREFGHFHDLEWIICQLLEEE